MVSLGEGHGGHAHSFTDYEHHNPGLPEPNVGMSTERLLEQQSAPASFFSRDDNVSTIPTTFIGVIQVFLLVSFIALMFILSDVLKTQFLGGVEPPFALLTCIHVVLWIFVVLIDRYLHYHHRMLRAFGYLDFYTSTKDIRRLPLWVLSLGNAVLLVIVSILGRSSSGVNLVHLFKIIVTVELSIALLATVIYIAWVVKFNRARLLPDAFRQKAVDGFATDMYTSPEIGFRDQDGLDQVVEKQTEMIRYLQQHNSNLGKKIVEMTQQIQRLEQRIK